MKALIQRLVFVGAWIDKGCQIFLGIQAALLLILVTVQIALRQLDVSISWATELSCLLFIWMSLLGSAISSRYLLHIGVDVLKDRLKGKVKRAILFVYFQVLNIPWHRLTIWLPRCRRYLWRGSTAHCLFAE